VFSFFSTQEVAFPIPDFAEGSIPNAQSRAANAPNAQPIIPGMLCKDGSRYALRAHGRATIKAAATQAFFLSGVLGPEIWTYKKQMDAPRSFAHDGCVGLLNQALPWEVRGRLTRVGMCWPVQEIPDRGARAIYLNPRTGFAVWWVSGLNEKTDGVGVLG